MWNIILIVFTCNLTPWSQVIPIWSWHPNTELSIQLIFFYFGLLLTPFVIFCLLHLIQLSYHRFSHNVNMKSCSVFQSGWFLPSLVFSCRSINHASQSATTYCDPDPNRWKILLIYFIIILSEKGHSMILSSSSSTCHNNWPDHKLAMPMRPALKRNCTKRSKSEWCLITYSIWRLPSYTCLIRPTFLGRTYVRKS